MSACITCWGDLRGLLMKTIESYFTLRVPRLGASIAFYTILSLAPLLVVVLTVASMVYPREAAVGQLYWQLHSLIGMQGAEMIRILLESAHRPGAGTLATIVGLVTLFFGSTGAVGELRDGLNYIWRVPDSGQFGVKAIIGVLRERTRSFAMVVGVGFLLLVSLAVNAAIAALGGHFSKLMPADEILLQIANLGFSFLVITFLFALMYRFLPDVYIEWEDVIVGAALTSLMFSIGKTLIGMYLGRAGLAGAYGAAGSLVVLVVWVYYSAQIFYLGAVFTKTYADKFGTPPRLRRRKAVQLVSSIDRPEPDKSAETKVEPKIEVVRSLDGDVMKKVRDTQEVPR